MDDSPRPGTSDDELAAFFESPESRRRAAAARPPARVAVPSDDDLSSFFHSPDGPASRAGGDGAPAGDGARGDGAAGLGDRDAFVMPTAPAAPPRPTGPAADRRRRSGRILAAMLGVVALGALVAVGAVAYYSKDLPTLEQIENPRNLLATQVYTADGVQLARYYDGENRTWVELDEMSDYVPQALLATEDRRFYDHWGMDLRGLIGAVAQALQGQQLRGASTITMQLSRNLYREGVGHRPGDRSVERKIREILLAIQIERVYTKDEILAAYLNTVPFLYSAYGIEAASQTYFSKPAAELEAPEAAVLIGMLAANNRYDPVKNPEASKARRNVVLANMVREGFLPAGELADVQAAPIRLAFDVYSHEDNVAPHFAEVLRLWFKEWCEKNGYDPYADGLVLRTTIDSRMQELANRAVEEEMDRLQGIVDRGWGSSANPFGYWWSRNTKIVNEYIGGTSRYTQAAGAPWSGKRADLDDAVLAELRQDAAFMDSLKTVKTQLEAGLIAMEPSTGRIKAWVGGRDFLANKYDHAGQARRQPGSTFKLFAYTAVFDNGYSPGSTVYDSPFRWGDWAPENAGGYSGAISVASALHQSKNVVAARITQHFGQSEIVRKAYQMGIRSALELPPPLVNCTHNKNLRQYDLTCAPGQTFVSVPTERWAQECPPFGSSKNDCYARSIALGTSDVNLLEMVAAYSTIANYGVYHGPSLEEERPRDPGIPPHVVLAIDRIEDRYGNVIEDFTPVGREVLSPSTAYTTFDTMRGVIRSGTGRGLGGFKGVGPLDVAGKTGTTQENADGWFVGMTPQLVVGSWTGFDDRRITYPSTSVGQGGRTGLRNVGAFLSLLQTEGDSLIRLDPKVKMDKPENYVAPTRRARIGGVGYWPGERGGRSRSRSSRSRSSSSSGSSSSNRNNSGGSRPAREILNQMQGGSRPAPPPPPPPPPSSGGGRIGW